MAQSLEDFAGLAGRQQQWERAARLLGAAEAVCADLGTTLPVAIAAEYWRTVSGARSALGEAGAGGAEGALWGPGPGRFGREADSAGGRAPWFAAAWAAGRAMSLADVVAFALAAEA